ncbi:glycosyltransferase family 9 protein [Polynucleobacter sp. MWH-UH25E]|uniref:glycosyltransferase family 9 protein n=1 Tax=Polynucleobacter sp. MWH-UH25E TaxID=1855616 RepID=UPI001BFEDBFC|nr:glycosyltransferase family 9 protein [Polynucleobacter sp. MWH-UH25E]QWD62364.1 hypothetical protein ICV39_01740 [Polynucleobacter sp. MWH-UH25E]
MNKNILLLLDGFSKGIIYPVIFLVFLFKLLFKGRRISSSNGRYLLIKIMGGGNLISWIDVLPWESCDILTAKSNSEILKIFSASAGNVFIDTNRFLGLAFSTLYLLRLYWRGQYDCIINMESESAFAKLISITVPSKRVVGITNIYRSVIDRIVYDEYMVSPYVLSRKDSISQIVHFHPKRNTNFLTIVNSHQEVFKSKFENYIPNDIIIAPTCSEVDELRRMPNSFWKLFFGRIHNSFYEKITIIFPSKNDPQYSFFHNLAASIGGIKIALTGYEEFIYMIKNAGLVVTLDSQALHVAQLFKVPAIAFYGPTSPIGVDLRDTTYPLTAGLQCSPCTHKYFVKPCNDSAYCTQTSYLSYELPFLQRHD